jgi:predicted translin family RNA/ssDNA-binding protein
MNSSIKTEEVIMDYENGLIEIDKKIQRIKKAVEELKEIGKGFPSLYQNSHRILASIKMLELNISDIKDLAA